MRTASGPPAASARSPASSQVLRGVRVGAAILLKVVPTRRYSAAQRGMLKHTQLYGWSRQDADPSHRRTSQPRPWAARAPAGLDVNVPLILAGALGVLGAAIHGAG